MRRNGLAGVSVVVSLLLGAAIALAQQQKPIEKFTAFAASLGTGKSGVIQIDITRWSTDEEREALLTTLQEFGPNKLLDALQKIRPTVGNMRMPGTLSWDLYYARNQPNPDGSRRVVTATNRAVAFRETMGGSRSMQYQFTLIEIHLDKDGKGEGKLVPAARVSWTRRQRSWRSKTTTPFLSI